MHSTPVWAMLDSCLACVQHAVGLSPFDAASSYYLGCALCSTLYLLAQEVLLALSEAVCIAQQHDEGVRRGQAVDSKTLSPCQEALLALMRQCVLRNSTTTMWGLPQWLTHNFFLVHPRSTASLR